MYLFDDTYDLVPEDIKERLVELTADFILKTKVPSETVLSFIKEFLVILSETENSTRH